MSDLVERLVAGEIAEIDFEGNTSYESARLMIASLSEAGYVIVPRVPTEAMARAGVEGYDFDDSLGDEATENNKRYAGYVYGTMIDAALT